MSTPSRGSSPALNKGTNHKEDIAPLAAYHGDLRVKIKSPEERQLALQAALKIDPGVDAWSVRAMYFYLIVMCVFCCSGDIGFDGTVMSGINTMTQYR